MANIFWDMKSIRGLIGREIKEIGFKRDSGTVSEGSLYTSLKAGNDDVKRLITLMTKQSGHTLARSLTGFADEGFEDGELLWRMLNGDDEAFDALYDRWERIVYQFALRMSGSVALAEDVTQDVF